MFSVYFILYCIFEFAVLWLWFVFEVFVAFGLWLFAINGLDLYLFVACLCFRLICEFISCMLVLFWLLVYLLWYEGLALYYVKLTILLVFDLCRFAGWLFSVLCLFRLCLFLVCLVAIIWFAFVVLDCCLVGELLLVYFDVGF